MRRIVKKRTGVQICSAFNTAFPDWLCMREACIADRAPHREAQRTYKSYEFSERVSANRALLR